MRLSKRLPFSDKGGKLSGTFKSEYTGECHFTGKKVATMPWGSRVDPEMEWRTAAKLLTTMLVVRDGKALHGEESPSDGITSTAP
jgi:hypothetical protein